MNVGNEIRIQTANQRKHGKHAIRIEHGNSPIVHADTSKRDRKQMEAIYPDFDSADRNKDSLQLNKDSLTIRLYH